MSHQLTLFGHPVSHSISPMIYEFFAQQTGIDLSFTKTDLPLEGFAEGLKAFRSQGGMGANVTLPFKEQAYELCDELSMDARLAKAVNTLHWDKEQWFGTNTDGRGFVRDLKLRNFSVRGKRVLILGAGGAARGLMGPLLEEQPEELWVANRTPEKAIALCKQFGLPDRGIGLFELDEFWEAFDLTIQATSAYAHGEDLDISDHIYFERRVYDLMYDLEKPTPFLEEAQYEVEEAFDGRGMLIEQAALAFETWFGILPDTQPLREKLMSYHNVDSV